VFSKSTTFVPEFGSMVPIILVLSIISIIAVSYRSNLQIRF
ncbi:MAG: PEFG-CTERM sorting domain-containing protein, partial [Thaumarchaeota archaeon]